MYKYYLTLGLGLLMLQQASAQSQISSYINYNIPLGRMEWSYKAAPGIKLFYSGKRRMSKSLSSTMGVGIGYVRFNPLADTLYFISDRGGVNGITMGRAIFSPFSIYMLSGQMGFEKKLNKKTRLILSLEVGYYYGKRDYQIEDDFGISDGVSEIVGRGAVSPNVGLAFDLNKSVSISPYLSYSLMIELGNTDQNAIDYNPATGSIMHFYSPGIALYLKL